jgi:hypothetical protein
MRREARAIRDDAIAAAREAYERRLAAIANRQAKQNGKRLRAGRGVMLEAIPSGWPTPWPAC